MHTHAILLGIFIVTAFLSVAGRSIARWFDGVVDEFEQAENEEWK